MKLLLYADAHFSLSSSIMIGKSNTISGRLENLIESFQWINKLAKDHNVDKCIDLGDLTDSDKLSSEVITSLGKCDLADHIHIVGNHSISSSDGEYNSINMYPNVITKPTIITDELGSKILLLPYSRNHDDLSQYNLDPNSSIILSHNDILGINYGNSLSTSGYRIDDIINNCALFINGHIHSSQWVVPNRICNLGVLTGLNFSGLESEWTPSVAILNTNPLSVEIIPNPHAIIFKKYTINEIFELNKILNSLDSSYKYAIQIKAPSNLVSDIKSILDNRSNIIKYYRVLPQFSTKVANRSTPLVEFHSTKSEYDKLRSYIESKSKMSADKSLVMKLISKLESDI